MDAIDIHTFSPFFTYWNPPDQTLGYGVLASPETALQGISMKSVEKAGPAKVGPEFLVAVHTKGGSHQVRSCSTPECPILRKVV